MTKNEERQLFKKIAELLKQHTDAVLLSVTQKMASGGVDPESYNLSNYALAKVLLTSALHDHKDDFTPLNPKQLNDVQNLNHF